MLTMKPFMAN